MPENIRVVKRTLPITVGGANPFMVDAEITEDVSTKKVTLTVTAEGDLARILSEVLTDPHALTGLAIHGFPAGPRS